jgi:hypothetical protein
VTLIRWTCSLLLALSLFSCGDDAAVPAIDPFTPKPTAVPLAIAVLPDVPDSPKAMTTDAAIMAFPSAPIYNVQSSVLSPTTSTPAAEEHVAINPLNNCVWVEAISDFSIRGTFNTTKYAITYDFGETWQEGFMPVNGTASGGKLLSSDGQQWDANSDPVVAFDRLGNVYITSLYFNGSGKKNGIYIAKKAVGTSGPLTFSSTDILPVITNLSNPIQESEDKEWMAVDNSTGTSTFKNRVYISWSRFNATGPGNSRIMITWSSDQAATWSAPLQISPASQNGAVQGSQVAVGPDGTVYVTWDTAFVGGHQMYFSKSTNGGVAWTTPIAITPLFNDITFTAPYRYDSFPSLAVGPVNGELYVVYPDQPTANSTIKFIRSTNGGTTWSTPVVLNDVSSGQRLMPSITADDQNNLHVCWFDTRNGANAQTYDIYMARGSLATGSLVWGASNVRVTPTSITTNQTFIGDYGGIASSSFDDGAFVWGFAVPAWTGSGNTQILKTAVLGCHP